MTYCMSNCVIEVAPNFNLYDDCVTGCMGGTESRGDNVQGPMYSLACSQCFGTYADCMRLQCDPCVLGPFSVSCYTCAAAETNCLNNFVACSTFQPAEVTDSKELPVVIIGSVAGGVGGFVLLLALAVVFYLRRRSTDEEIMAKYGANEEAFSTDVRDYSSYAASPALSNAVNPYLYKQGGRVGGSGPGGVPTALPASGLGATTSFAGSTITKVGNVPIADTTAPLRPGRMLVMFDFSAENKDELDVKAKQVVTGIQKDGEWWLVQNDKGKVGLVPASYLAMTK